MDDFLWGAGTAAYQVEGNIRNDWEEWGAAHPAQEPAREAADHFQRYEEDLEIMRGLGLNAYRFSVEWSRVEPEEGQVCQEALDHYAGVVGAARKRGIEPIVTLWHFTLPLWLAESGGWEHPDAVRYYVRFVGWVAQALGSQVRYWLTLNEPEIYLTHAYVLGDYPPGQRRWWRYPALLRRFLCAHRSAYATLKKVNPEALVGVAKDVFQIDAGEGLLNRAMKRLLDAVRVFLFFDRTSRQQDFLGINYYVRFELDWRQLFRKNGRVLRDTGWEGAADGLPRLLERLYARYGKPILITENGTVDEHDSHRGRYLAEMVNAISQVHQKGIPVIGYIHWSLLDSFEWKVGYSLRFGLVGVDRQNGLARRIKKSAKKFGALIRGKKLS